MYLKPKSVPTVKPPPEGISTPKKKALGDHNADSVSAMQSKRGAPITPEKLTCSQFSKRHRLDCVVSSDPKAVTEVSAYQSFLRHFSTTLSPTALYAIFFAEECRNVEVPRGFTVINDAKGNLAAFMQMGSGRPAVLRTITFGADLKPVVFSGYEQYSSNLTERTLHTREDVEVFLQKLADTPQCPESKVTANCGTPLSGRKTRCRKCAADQRICDSACSRLSKSAGTNPTTTLFFLRKEVKSLRDKLSRRY